MKKLGFRFIIGLITFTIGSSFVCSNWNESIQYCGITYYNQKVKTEPYKYSASENGKIEIRFIGYGKIENRLTAKFQIINHNSHPISYSAYGNSAEIPIDVRFNGKEDNRMRCGTGLVSFELLSGESFEKEIILDNFTYEYLHKEGSYEFGSYFRLRNESEAKRHWSEPIVFSKDMKKEMIKNLPEFLKQR
jgi:hypothetical protein